MSANDRDTASSHRFSVRTLRLTARIIWAVCLLLAAVGFILLLINHANLLPVADVGPFLGLAMAVGYGTLGVVIITHRPRHGMGWLFIFLAAPAALSAFTQQYALYRTFEPLTGPLPGARYLAWMSNWLQYLFFPAGLALPYMLFPDGHLPSRRWRPMLWIAVVSALMLILNYMTQPGYIIFYLREEIRLPFTNPFGFDLRPFRTGLDAAWILALIVLVGSLLAPILRYRRARGVEREQLKWFVYFGILTLALFPFSFVLGDFGGSLFLALTILILPVAAAIAILRYRLYDIDIVIKRTLVYGLLTASLGAIYFGSIITLQTLFRRLAGQESPAAIVLSTLLIAALFTPLRRRVQNFIDRRFFRASYNAQQTLAAFAQTARDEVDVETLTAELTQVIQETMQPEQVSVWLKPAD